MLRSIPPRSLPTLLQPTTRYVMPAPMPSARRCHHSDTGSPEHNADYAL